MTDEDHQALKLYAVAVNKTMSDVINDCTRSSIHHHRELCGAVQSVLSHLPEKKQAQKACWGWKCNACKHTTRCKAGIYQGFFEIDTHLKRQFMECKDPRLCTYDPLTNSNHHFLGGECRKALAPETFTKDNYKNLKI